MGERLYPVKHMPPEIPKGLPISEYARCLYEIYSGYSFYGKKLCELTKLEREERREREYRLGIVRELNNIPKDAWTDFHYRVMECVRVGIDPFDLSDDTI